MCKLPKSTAAGVGNEAPDGVVKGDSTSPQTRHSNPMKMSSGVAFNPEGRYWRIGGEWYDFVNFSHPGGNEIIRLCRDRFDDATYAFEAHHMDYKKARAIIGKYRVGEGLQKVLKEKNQTPAPKLLGDESFYSDVRRRTSAYFRKIKKEGHTNGLGPTRQCITLFWISVALWLASIYYCLIVSKTIHSAILQGIAASILGAFGHNWIHQPKYKLWAYLSLDTIGFSSDQWYREHILQHHMYTNTPLDNHFKGTDPFLVTDPTVERNWFQRVVTPILNPLVLIFGIWGNYSFHASEMLRGNEKLQLGKLIFPSIVYTFYRLEGWWGLALFFVNTATTGIYYFTMALMNHNSEKTLDVARRNSADDWGIAQICSCADWAVQTKFLPSIVYLWLNYHCVHHLFPLTDFSHHRDIQAILMETCLDHNVEYEAGDFFDIYRQMVNGFGNPRSLWMEINAYNGS
ncbi:hypothetical protein TrCOL_g931 [Triparma columacea]|uniref:Fatty acid desaturase domain-containing protein n=1 Tax=Triparma columacea TaxID=722753 RepID=A0A9W7G8N7_9STRA|nr:hypothetical protein TrCOL_g931 [Triparma columacea]